MCIILTCGSALKINIEKMITLTIPVPNYLYKYLVHLYGEKYQPTMYDELGIMVLSVLERKSNATAQRYEPKNFKGKNCDKHFVIHLSFSQFERNGFFIFNEKIHTIQAFIDNQFRLSMYRNAITNYNQMNIPYKDSILCFLASYGIEEEDFSYESIRRDFNRKKEKLNI